MSNWEFQLITKIVDTGNIQLAHRRGLKDEHFLNQECKTVYQYIQVHYRSPSLGGVPSRQYIEDKFPDFDFEESRDTLAAIITRVQDDKLYFELRDVMEKVKSLSAEDERAALEHMKQRTVELVGASRTDPVLDATQCAADMRLQYEEAKKLKGVTGLEYPWPQLTKDTGGANTGDLITIAGRPGTMKTWQLMNIANHWHANLDKKILILTKEMKPELLRKRAFSLYSGLNYNRIKDGKLTPAEERQYFDDLEAWEEIPGFHITYLRSTGAQAMTEMQSLVDTIEPEAILVDGFYFIGERDYKVTAQCTSLLKELLIERWLIPGVINTQLNQAQSKDKGTFMNVDGGAYGDSYAQDSDVMIKLKLGPEERMAKEVMHAPVKVREGTGRPYFVHAIPGCEMGQKRLADGFEHVTVEDTVVIDDDEEILG